MKTKVCKECGLEKSVDLFRTHHHRCKACNAELAKLYRKRIKDNETEEEKELRTTNHREYYRERMSDPAIREKKTKQNQERYIKNPKLHMLHRAKQRAKKKGLEFSITLDDIEVPELCPVFKIPMIAGGDSFNSPSLDRIDSSKGYTKDNIMVISYRANTLKNDATFEEIKMLFEFYNKLNEDTELHTHYKH